MKPQTRRERRVLGFCNRIRKYLGRQPVEELEKGYMDTSIECPIAKTIGDEVSVGYSWIEIDNPYTEYDMPEYAQDFVKSFDAGRIPHLIKD